VRCRRSATPGGTWRLTARSGWPCWSFFAAAWKFAARDTWIGGAARYPHDRPPLIANDSRFLVLSAHYHPNLASRALTLAERRVALDWQVRFSDPLRLRDTFVDPSRFHGTIYRAANWRYVGDTRGFRRTRTGYGVMHGQPKRAFVRPLHAAAQARLFGPFSELQYRRGAPKLMLTAEQMRALSDLFADIPDLRRAQGQRHPLPAVLAIATAAVLFGRIAATKRLACGRRTATDACAPACAAATSTAAISSRAPRSSARRRSGSPRPCPARVERPVGRHHPASRPQRSLGL